jgi:hypothetical protein
MAKFELVVNLKTAKALGLTNHPRRRRRGHRMRCVVAAPALWLCAAIPAFAQNAGNLPIVGILRINTADNAEPSATGFKDALAAFG